MKTLIVSDIHFGNNQGYDAFAGSEALQALLEQFVTKEARVIIAGDSVDFLMNEDPLELDVDRAIHQASDIAETPDVKAVFKILGQILKLGGQVIVRLGNHDVELALPQVQHVFRKALNQPDEISQRLEFQLGRKPWIIEEQSARVLVAHGEHTDSWNRIDYKTLFPDGEISETGSFNYPPGSRLVKTLLNPLKRSYNMRFADLLKPDFQGAVLTALAVDPTAVKVVFKKSNIALLWQLFRRMGGAVPADFAPAPDFGLHERVNEANLSELETDALEKLLGHTGPVAFDAKKDPLVDSALQKLGIAGLRLYSNLHRTVAGDSGEAFFELTPSEDEWKEARRLAEKFDVQGVVLGHTHAARYKSDTDLTLINTGTWIWLMKLPAHDAGDKAWLHFLRILRNNPGLDPKQGESPPLLSRFSGATLEPHKTGAKLSLVQWTSRGTLETIDSQYIEAKS